jgi:hypothetical protein
MVVLSQEYSWARHLLSYGYSNLWIFWATNILNYENSELLIFWAMHILSYRHLSYWYSGVIIILIGLRIYVVKTAGVLSSSHAISKTLPVAGILVSLHGVSSEFILYGIPPEFFIPYFRTSVRILKEGVSRNSAIFHVWNSKFLCFYWDGHQKLNPETWRLTLEGLRLSQEL